MLKVDRVPMELVSALLHEINSKSWRHVTSDGDFWVQSEAPRPYIGRVVKVSPGGFVHKHTDDGPMKRHLVLQTNPEAFCYSGGVQYQLETCCVYEFDASLEHWSENNGETDRIHIIL